MGKAEGRYQALLHAAGEPGLSTSELDVAAYQMSEAANAKGKAETDLQAALTDLQAIDTLIDIAAQEKELKAKGIWKQLGALDPEELQENVTRLAKKRKNTRFTVNQIAEIGNRGPFDVQADRSPEFIKSRKAIEELRNKQG